MNPAKRGWLCLATGLLTAGAAAAQVRFESTGNDASQVFLDAARSVAFGDHDRDGWVDLLLLGGSDRYPSHVLLHNAGEGLLRPVEGFLPDIRIPTGGGGVWGDFDNDGDLDILVPRGRYYARASNLLLENREGRFADVSEHALPDMPEPTDNAVWADVDRDGWLDLLTGNLATPDRRNRLLQNLGDGTFTDITSQAGLDVQLDPQLGGSNGGMVATDLSGDGWPDIYFAVFDAPNRFFLNDGTGGFLDATRPEWADEGEAFGLAAGDIDNDGDLDLYGATGGSLTSAFGAFLLLNQGDGTFIDVTDAIGLDDVEGDNLLGASFADFDNDGDVDLLIGWGRTRLFLNDGTGLFVEQPGHGIANETAFTIATGDVDRDGDLDVLAGGGGGHFPRLYLNQGAPNHWLQVELVGRQSNRDGIGARVVIESALRTQTRHILGGTGYTQDEMVAHFGLGSEEGVSALTVHWPSGQTDRLGPVAADRRIRIVEGTATHIQALPVRVATDRPLTAGRRSRLQAELRTAPFWHGGQVQRVTADLSPLGGDEVPLTSIDGWSYRLDTELVAPADYGSRTIRFRVEQGTEIGPHLQFPAATVLVAPAADLSILPADGPGWVLDEPYRASVERNVSSAIVARLSTAPTSARGWVTTWRSPVSLVGSGWRELRLTLRLDGLTRTVDRWLQLNLIGVRGVRSRLYVDGHLDPAGSGWQTVSLPVPPDMELTGITLSGNQPGVLDIADLRLVTVLSPRETAVRGDHQASVPEAFALLPNHPNPFNASTVVRYRLDAPADVELAVYNLAGQRLSTLDRGRRAAGTHSVAWDGHDHGGQPVATGVYLCRLSGAGRQATRSLLLLR